MALDPFGLPPEEAVKWFREKGYALTFDWRDMMREQHARAFTVAKATHLDLLADIREAVDKAIAGGGTLGEFTKTLKPTLQKKGWWGEKEVDELDVDGKPTGETKLVQLGSPHRLRTIYETNLRQAQAAGRWERFQRTKVARPYARYVCLLDGSERAEHRAWHGIVLPLDDAWWSTHAPPNGWGCRCKMQQLSDRDLERYGYKLSEAAPPDEMRLWKNDRTGVTTKVPKGIDPRFDYNPGQSPRGYIQPPRKREIALENVKTWKDVRPDGKPLPSARELAKRGDMTPAVERWYDIQSEKDAGERWNALFGGRDSREVADPLGQQITFSTRGLMHAMAQGGVERASFVPRAKQAVEKPIEIWLQPSRRADGSVVMRTVYIGVFDGRKQGVVTVVERTDSGHAFWTLYPTDKIDDRRRGYLQYAGYTVEKPR